MCPWGAGCEFAAELAEGAKYSKYQKSIRRRQGCAGRDSKNTYQNLKIRLSVKNSGVKAAPTPRHKTQDHGLKTIDKRRRGKFGNWEN